MDPRQASAAVTAADSAAGPATSSEMSHLPVEDKGVLAESVVADPAVPDSAVEAAPAMPNSTVEAAPALPVASEVAAPGQPEDEEMRQPPQFVVYSPAAGADSDSSSGTFPPGGFTWHNWFAGTEMVCPVVLVVVVVVVVISIY